MPFGSKPTALDNTCTIDVTNSTSKCQFTQHTQLSIIKVVFTNKHEVIKDDGDSFPDEDWSIKQNLSNHAGSYNVPICYSQTSKNDKKFELTATVKIDKAPSCSECVKLYGSVFVSIPKDKKFHRVVELTIKPNNLDVTKDDQDKEFEIKMISNFTVPQYVDHIETLDIIWKYRVPNNNTEMKAGTSVNELFITLSEPATTSMYWTLLDLSCKAAQYQTTLQDVATSISDRFRIKNNRSQEIKRRTDGVKLGYWLKNLTRNHSTTTKSLLVNPKGSGQCGAWAELLVDIFRCQGIKTAKKVEIKHSESAISILVKNWFFLSNNPTTAEDRKSNPVGWPYKLADLTDKPGVPGQNNANPPSAFGNHYIVHYDGYYYDPSYGSAAVKTELEWENMSLDGFLKTATRSNDFYAKKLENQKTKYLTYTKK